MDIGKEKEKITVEPLRDPVPKRDPVPTPPPERQPVPPPTPKPERVGHEYSPLSRAFL